MTRRPMPEGFADFWAAYPRKVARLEAEKAWRQVNIPPLMLPRVLDALAAQTASELWSDVRYIPHAATWLRGRRWEDELEAPAYEPPAAIAALLRAQRGDHAAE